MGTSFDPDSVKVGNQGLHIWLAQRLNPSISFSFRKVEHPDGTVIILEIPAATSAPIEYEGTAFVRIGSATPKLSEYPEYFQKLIDKIRACSWEKGIAKSFLTEDDVLKLLDYPSYFKLTDQRLPDNRAGIFELLSAEQLISKDVGGRWDISNLGAILFASDLTQFDSAISQKSVRFIAYEGNNKASTVTHRQDGKKGYATGFEGLVSY